MRQPGSGGYGWRRALTLQSGPRPQECTDRKELHEGSAAEFPISTWTIAETPRLPDTRATLDAPIAVWRSPILGYRLPGLRRGVDCHPPIKSKTNRTGHDQAAAATQ